MTVEQTIFDSHTISYRPSLLTNQSLVFKKLKHPNFFITYNETWLSVIAFRLAETCLNVLCRIGEQCVEAHREVGVFC